MKIEWKKKYMGGMVLALSVLSWLFISCSSDGKNSKTEDAQPAQPKGHLVFYAMPG